MRKKIIICALCIGGIVSAQAQGTASPEVTEVKTQGAQTEVTGDWVPSEEVNTIQESELTREMLGEEKAASEASAEMKSAGNEAERKAKQKIKAQNAAENDSHGFAITIIAMIIVIAALLVLSILFQLFGQVSSSLQKARKRAAHGVSEHEAEDHHEELDSGEVIAAISMALAEHTGQGHDIEDTILTIRKLRKAYSPWNSKIYNMRLMPEHNRHHPKTGKR